MRHARPLLVVAALGAAVVLTPSLASAAPAGPHQKPTVASVQKQLGALAMKSSQIVDAYNTARVVVATREKAAAAASRSAAVADKSYQGADVEFTQILQAQYESGSIGAAGALLDSDSGNNYLDRLDTMKLISTHDADVVSLVTKTRSTARLQAAKAQSLLAAAKKERDGLAAKRKSVQTQIAKYQSLLSTLTAEQQAKYASSSNPITSSSKATAVTKNLPGASSAAAKRAVNFALAQLGKPYVFGASGPGSYDCSGLTMRAWQAGGISLPHSAADQYNYGTHISRSQLQPGDLVFFYQPIGHVTIYVGNGLMVSAPTEGEPVQLVSLNYYNSDYTGATHL